MSCLDQPCRPLSNLGMLTAGYVKVFDEPSLPDPLGTILQSLLGCTQSKTVTSAQKDCDVESFTSEKSISDEDDQGDEIDLLLDRCSGPKRYLQYDTAIQNCAVSARVQSRQKLENQMQKIQQQQCVKGALAKEARKADQRAGQRRGLTKEDRATTDQVLDEYTLVFLEKLYRKSVFVALYGCISTGKEANVYVASTSSPTLWRAIKIFKTSILVFKDRARYISGDHRFRSGYTGCQNSRKMVRQWAEKEFRNLRRISDQGLRCPQPVEIRGHVLVMDFLGNCDGGSAACPLKKLAMTNVDPFQWRLLYVEVLVIMRTFHQQCRLVHGDLSEYNILYHQGHAYVIDVSQSVQVNSPFAFGLLKRDVVNVVEFFNQYKPLICQVKKAAPTDLRQSEDNQDHDTDKPATDRDEVESVQIPKLLEPFKLLGIYDLYQYITSNQHLVESEVIPIPDWPELDHSEWSKVLQHRDDDIRSAETRRSAKETHCGDLCFARNTTTSAMLLEARGKFNHLCCQTYAWLVGRSTETCLENDAEELSDVLVNVFLKTWVPQSLHELKEQHVLAGEITQANHEPLSQYAHCFESGAASAPHEEAGEAGLAENKCPSANEEPNSEPLDEETGPASVHDFAQIKDVGNYRHPDRKEWKRMVKKSQAERRVIKKASKSKGNKNHVQCSSFKDASC